MRKIYFILASAVCALVLASSPVYAAADPAVPAPMLPAGPLLITEVQPGSRASASEEFIELFNATGQPIDLSMLSWHIEFTNSTATGWQPPYRTVPLTGTIAPGGVYVIASEYKSGSDTIRYLSDAAGAWFSAGMAASAGHVRLVYEVYTDTEGSCILETRAADVVEWTGTDNEQPLAGSFDARNLFVEAAKSIYNRFSLQRTADAAGYHDTDDDMADFTVADPTPGVVWQPAAGAPQNTMLPPQHGCTPQEPTEPSEPPETTPPPPVSGSDDPETPAEEPPVEPDGNRGSAPQISELLPNPAAPRTDAADEYVELYNPNDSPFALDGYVLEAGITTKRRYTFPDGTSLPAGYTAFYASQTGLSLSNEAGRVSLFDPEGVLIMSTDQYTQALDDKAWVFLSGSWQWSAMPTPNAPNALVATATAKKGTTSGTAKKPAAVKAATAKSVKSTPARSVQAKQSAAVAAAATTEPRRPIHTSILAAIGVFAVLYGAYEYRHDLANKYRQLRSYRVSRRKAGSGA